MTLDAQILEDGFVRLEPLADRHCEGFRSRAAVLELGAVHEGTMRQDKVAWTGRIRDTAVYSILHHEWPAVCDQLDDRLDRFVRQKASHDVLHPAA